MPTPHHIAAWILRSTGPVDALTLQKLLYYAQSWSLAERDQPAFDGVIEAWRNGPVVPSVWNAHRYPSTVSEVGGDLARVDSTLAAILADVLTVYGSLTGEQLVEITHAEPGWLIGRRGSAPGEASNAPVVLDRTVAFLRRSQEGSRVERMREALERSLERAQLRRVLAPHRATMLRLAQ